MLQTHLESQPGGRRPQSIWNRLRCLLSPLIALTVIGVGGCGGNDGGSRPEGGQRGITFESCGQTVTLDRAVRRVVITNDAIADTLFALSIGDRIVAKTHGESAPLPQLKARLASLPNLGTRNPSTEALVAAKPDLLITDQVAKVSGNQGSPTVAELMRMGIATYVVGGGCATGLTSDSSGLESLFTDVRQLGAIFGVPGRARALADRLRTRPDDVRRRTARQPRPGVAELSHVAGQLYVTSGGLANDVIGRAGGTNLFAGLPGQFAPISAEQIIARNPQAIIVDDFTASAHGRREAIAFVTRTFPTTDAVKQRRILVIDAAKTGARGSTRPVDGVVEIARFLHPSAFGTR
jgi:iron complex transport system substrate-binding protein